MKSSKKQTSLQKRFKRLAIRWSSVGALLTLLLILPVVSLVIKHSSERQISVVASTLTRAFRPAILAYRFRDAKLQIEDVANLKSGESISIVDENYKLAMKDGIEAPPASHCAEINTPCWLDSFPQVSISQAIYFNDDSKKEIFGYLVLRLSPTIDWLEILFIILSGFIVFAFQVRKTYTDLTLESAYIGEVLAEWKKQIDNPKAERLYGADYPLPDEFLPLDESIKLLHKSVDDLENIAASNAAVKAKIDIVRGLGHDLKTPLSQLSKYFAIFVANTERNHTINRSEVINIEASLSRMGAVIKQVTNFDSKVDNDSKTELNSWIEAYLNEIKETTAQNLNSIKLGYHSQVDQEAIAQVDEMAIFRLLDNLVKNSIESFPVTRTGHEHIEILLKETGQSFEVSVSDNGSGIPEDIQNKIFDLDFTTKKTRGTGLGLGIVKKICFDLGLDISFKSESGSGTTFTLSFPKLKKIQQSALLPSKGLAL